MITARPGACRSLLCCATTTQALPQSVFKAAQSALYTMTSPSMTSPSAPSGPTSAVLSYSPFPRTEERPGPGGVSVEHGEGFIGPWNDVNNRRYEYPCLIQGKDGRIHVAYAWGYRKRIKYLCMDEAWIRGEKLCKGVGGDETLTCKR